MSHLQLFFSNMHGVAQLGIQVCYTVQLSSYFLLVFSCLVAAIFDSVKLYLLLVCSQVYARHIRRRQHPVASETTIVCLSPTTKQGNCGL